MSVLTNSIPVTGVLDMSVLDVPYRPANMFKMTSLIDGEELWLPNPETSSANGLIATLVNSGRNGNGVVTAQKIGRDQDKTSMTWSFLHKELWEEMVQFWDKNFFFNFTYYSPVASTKITRKFYISDREYRPYAINENGDPIAYVDCSANVVDTGEGT